MRFDPGYFEEKKFEKSYDAKMLRRLYPFISPYKKLVFSAIFLVVIITILDLSLPYVTKIAIDRYIVPKTDTITGKNITLPEEGSRYLTVTSKDPEVVKVIEKYSGLFQTDGPNALITFDDLAKLEKKDLAKLRKGDIAGVTLLSVLFFVLVVLNFVVNFAQVFIMEYTGQKTMHDLRVGLFEHIMTLPVDFFSRNPAGRLVTRVTNDIQNMHDMFTSIIAFVFKDIFLLAGIAALLIWINPQLALISFTILPVVLFVSLYFSRQVRDVFRVLRIKLAEINTKFAETIGGIKVIQIFLQEQENYKSFEKLNHENYLAGMRQTNVLAIFMPVIELLGAVAIAVVIYYGGCRVLTDRISLGELVAFISYMKMFFTPIRDIAEKYNILQNAMASAERIFLILDNKTRDGSSSLRKPAAETGGTEDFDKIEEIVFKNVYFGYNKNENVLKGISFKIKSGESIAIVGPTGSGKTSLINLIIKFYAPLSGQILINGKDVNSADTEILRSKMAIVMQDPFMFSDTIRYNIFLGINNPPNRKIESLLDASKCRGLVKKMSGGIDTILSEGGESISSGERQLISIARALARNPSLIILDEATSYIDSNTEQKIQDALANLMKNRTSIIVAHRLSTARTASRIIVLNRGRIIETGTHENLMQRRGFYFRLNQFGG